MDIFEKATRIHLRFPFRGMITAEDLWDLPVEELDGLYGKLKSMLKTSQEDTLLGDVRTKEDKLVNLQIDIVKRIVEYKLDLAERRMNSRQKAAEREKLREILASKQDEELKASSVEDIQKKLADLESDEDDFED